MTARPKPPQAVVVVERSYAATVEELWSLWTTKEGFESWWGPQGFRVEVHALEPRWTACSSYDMIADAPEAVAAMKQMGQPISHSTKGRFAEFQPAPRRLTLVHLIDFIQGVEPYDSKIEVEFSAAGDKARMVVTLHPHLDPHWTKMSSLGFASQLAPSSTSATAGRGLAALLDGRRYSAPAALRGTWPQQGLRVLGLRRSSDPNDPPPSRVARAPCSPLSAVVALGAAACSRAANEEARETAAQVAADANQAIESASAKAEAAVDKAGDRAEALANETGDALDEAAARPAPGHRRGRRRRRRGQGGRASPRRRPATSPPTPRTRRPKGAPGRLIRRTSPTRSAWTGAGFTSSVRRKAVHVQFHVRHRHREQLPHDQRGRTRSTNSKCGFTNTGRPTSSWSRTSASASCGSPLDQQNAGWGRGASDQVVRRRDLR